MTTSADSPTRDRTSLLPHGVTGSGRALTPVFAHARGPLITDVDGRDYIDLHGGYGTTILGYGHPAVDDAVSGAMRDGRSFLGCAHPYEAGLAERLVDLLPEAERVALCGGGGTDPLYHAVRLARAVTGRRRVVKVEGGYQGWHGVLGASTAPDLPSADPTSRPETIPNSTGILPEVTAALLAVTVNDRASLEARFAEHGDDIAALVVEPVLFSAGCVLVDHDWLALARDLCDRHGAILVFDEVISGFRGEIGGAALPTGIVPDLAAYGKAIANGHVLSLLAGRGELIDELAPGGPVFYSGTFNGHPLGCAAANATLDVLADEDVHARAGALVETLARGVDGSAAARGLAVTCQSYGTGFCIYLGTTGVRDYRDLASTVRPGTLALNDAFRAHLVDAGIFIQYRRGTNRGFISGQHTPAHIEAVLAAVDGFLDAHADDERLAR